jgi:orotate phosphoribosyltransferase
VLIVDDVITAGTAIRESMTLLTAAEARPVAVVLALDRQEKGGDSPLSAVQVGSLFEASSASRILLTFRCADILDVMSPALGGKVPTGLGSRVFPVQGLESRVFSTQGLDSRVFSLCQSVREEFGLAVVSVVGLSDLLTYLQVRALLG